MSPEQISAEMSEMMISEPIVTVTVKSSPKQPNAEVGVTVYSTYAATPLSLWIFPMMSPLSVSPVATPVTVPVTLVTSQT